MAMTVPQIELPEVLAVFPLTGVMLLPGTVLPLHIFEPRYRAMVEDALEGSKVFGMIQPFTPQDDNRGPQPGAAALSPDLYKIGCAGYIEKWEKLPDGRFFVQLKGVNRFRFNEELDLQRGYRRVRAEYGEFADAEIKPDWQCDRSAFTSRRFHRTASFRCSSGTTGINSINTWSVVLPSSSGSIRRGTWCAWTTARLPS